MNKDQKKFQSVEKKKTVEQNKSVYQAPKKPDVQTAKKTDKKSGSCGCS